ncbi:L-fucose permease [Raoultella terrigena]|uniref:L-fucose permease n=1 Tax=Raoultella terrigena TaxID=577 RepID=A0A3P8KFZ3_RAOTE|nr:L-fucose permease [Raoultella terrigena]
MPRIKCSPAYALLSMVLCLISALSGGHIGLLALTLCSAFMSIQYPTIFSLGIKKSGAGHQIRFVIYRP